MIGGGRGDKNSFDVNRKLGSHIKLIDGVYMCVLVYSGAILANF